MKNGKLREQIGFYIGRSKVNIRKFKIRYAISCGLLVLVSLLISIVNQNMVPLSVAIITYGSVAILYIMHTQETRSKPKLQCAC